MIYVNENRVTGDKKVIKKEGEEKSMKTNKPVVENKKNALILTSQLMAEQPFYITTAVNYLPLQEAYCKKNGYNIFSILNVPRATAEFEDWINKLRSTVKRAKIECIVLHTKDFEYQMFSTEMIYILCDTLGVELINEFDYMDDEESVDHEPDTLMLFYSPMISSRTKDDDILEARHQFYLQREALLATAKCEGCEVDPMVFIATSMKWHWDELTKMINIYRQIRGIDALLLSVDEEYYEFAKHIADYFSSEDVTVMVNIRKMKSVSHSMDIDTCLNLMVQIDEDDYDDLPFN